MDRPGSDKPIDIDPKRPWMAFENILSAEDGESFARAIEMAFPIESHATATNEAADADRRSEMRVSRLLDAEYDETTNSLRLLEPLEGFVDKEKVSIIVQHAAAKKPWSDLRGLLSGEEGKEFARVIDDAFPIEPTKK
jgi:hypothetical protein